MKCGCGKEYACPKCGRCLSCQHGSFFKYDGWFWICTLRGKTWRAHQVLEPEPVDLSGLHASEFVHDGAVVPMGMYGGIRR
jgi:hypothetical protein